MVARQFAAACKATAPLRVRIHVAGSVKLSTLGCAYISQSASERSLQRCSRRPVRLLARLRRSRAVAISAVSLSVPGSGTRSSKFR